MDIPASNFIGFRMVKLIVIAHILFIVTNIANASIVDYAYCKRYAASPCDKPNQVDEKGRPFLFMGDTYSKRYYLSNINMTASFFQGAFNICERFGMKLATIKTACDYGIVEKWFLNQYPTTYSAWIAGFRFGDYLRPAPLWITTGEPLDFSQFSLNSLFVGGPYPPGGYSPIPYPWINCLSVSRNCPLYTSGPTNPCDQTPIYPSLQFMWLDCRISTLRVICEETSYTKEGSNEIE